MKPETKRLKDVVAGIGIPRREIRAVTDLGVSHATVFDPEHVALVAENARLLADHALSVVIREYPCGCAQSVRISTDPRYAGSVERLTWEASPDHRCVEVHHPSPEEWDAAAEQALTALGLTFAELAEQARTGEFSSPRARQLWLTLKPGDGLDPKVIRP